jgi:NADPH-dependent 2,4-dienoyl-CoA reductase/sulfur reductase-like enzyme
MEKGAVLVNERFETNVSGVYATGDVASFHDPIFRHRRLIQHWTNANHHGERLGRLLAGDDAPYDLVAYFFSEVFGTKLGFLGDLEQGHDELVVRGSLEEGALTVFYLREGRLVAALVSGAAMTAQNELAELLRGGAVVGDRAALEDADVPAGAAFEAGEPLGALST